MKTIVSSAKLYAESLNSGNQADWTGVHQQLKAAILDLKVSTARLTPLPTSNFIKR